jgi:predicted dehydrogenase
LDKELKVGIIGLGHLGSIHAKVYSKLPFVKIVGVSDINLHRTTDISRLYSTQSFLDYKNLIPLCDVLSIATPTETHFEIALDCILKGKHVLIEKPITGSLGTARLLIKNAKIKKVVLQVGHVERFNSAFQAIKKLLCLHPHFIECQRLSVVQSRSLDIGVVSDLMIHDIDIILGLIHSRIIRIDAVGIRILTPFEDVANVRIKFANGCVVNLTASRVSDETVRKMRIFLKDTYISVDYQEQKAAYYHKEGNEVIKTIIPVDREESLKKEIESFLSCVRSGKKPIVSGVEATKALEVATLIRNIISKNLKND